MQSEGLSVGLHNFLFRCKVCVEELHFCAGFPVLCFRHSSTFHLSVSFCLWSFLVAVGSVYTDKTFRYSCLSQLIFFRLLVLTMMNVRVKGMSCMPASVLTCEGAAYAIPGLKTLSDRSITAQSKVKDPDICGLQHMHGRLATVFYKQKIIAMN